MPVDSAAGKSPSVATSAVFQGNVLAMTVSRGTSSAFNYLVATSADGEMARLSGDGKFSLGAALVLDGAGGVSTTLLETLTVTGGGGTTIATGADFNGPIIVATGPSSLGPSGNLALSTGASTSGAGGSIVIAAGGGVASVGGAISVVAGTGANTGGDLVLAGGSGGTAQGGVRVTAALHFQAATTVSVGGTIQLTAGDSGSVNFVGSTTTYELPTAAAGLRFTFVTTYVAVVVTVQPTATDAIHGYVIGASGGTAVTSTAPGTLGTTFSNSPHATVGDRITLVSSGAATWYVVDGAGRWA